MLHSAATDRTPRLYVDSAETTAVSTLLRSGIAWGVTTNPTILDRAQRRETEIPALYEQWVAEGAHEVFFQTWGENRDDFVRHAHRMLQFGDRVVIKVPATVEGFAAASTLVREGAPVLLTAVYTVGQALAAASVGARYIAPYLGRLRDAQLPGDELIAHMQQVCEGSATDVLAASLRSAEDIVNLRLAGIRYFTAAPAVLDELVHHPITESSAEQFEQAMTQVRSRRLTQS
ncbi:transaldolase family protein [Microbacterium sp. YY-01]|uniref:transaldolase family protein n=1 Tax=Microbacterium sp. YY-01 TaxID=3421634 RepID=UPI003D17D454